MKLIAKLLALASFSLLMTGCVTNPVTGKSQLSIMSPEQEIATGTQNYGPGQQAQGGQYMVDPGLTAYVQQVGKKLAAVSDRPNLPYEFVVLNNDVPNAWAMPGGKLAINRGLLVYLEDEAQLAAVLGHEIVHAAARHSAQQQTQNVLLGAGVLLAGVAIAEKKPEYGMLGMGAMAVGAQAWQAKYGRNHELESDEVGMKYMAKAGYDAQAAVELQEIFVKLSEGRNSGFIEGLFASHPPSQERVARNRANAAKYPGGVRNKAQFQRAMAQVNKDKKAYANYQKAQKLASEKKYIDAMSYVEQSIAQQPKENLFWEMKGQLLMQQKKDSEAVVALDRAIQANPQYFKPYVFRGIAYKQLGKNDMAEKDLLTSQRYLPTQIATYYLGEVALAKGNRSQAAQYFQQAAQGGGEIGEAAKGQLGRLQ
uniref:M48 family metalloprotease n=1 Tax=Cellvibrio fontiphilus TaxID=1815559 RepID=UPI002B4BD3DC|nr:M48 family metalloprotease [Cellvibrio fontiphilus]